MLKNDILNWLFLVLDKIDSSESDYKIGFKEYVEEPYFYGNQLEGYRRELDVFGYWKHQIDDENKTELNMV